MFGFCVLFSQIFQERATVHQYQDTIHTVDIHIIHSSQLLVVTIPIFLRPGITHLLYRCTPWLLHLWSTWCHSLLHPRQCLVHTLQPLGHHLWIMPRAHHRLISQPQNRNQTIEEKQHHCQKKMPAYKESRIDRLLFFWPNSMQPETWTKSYSNIWWARSRS